MKTCDLHTHSFFSDGSCSPAEIITEAKQKELAVALTDHNTVAGLAEFMSEAKKQGVTAVAGVELSTDYEGIELHLLGLFIDPEHYESVSALTDKFHALKEASNINTVKKLNAKGFDIDYASVKQRSKNNNVNRVQIAEELCAKGYVASVKEAFTRYLDEGKGFYEPPTERLKFTDAIKFLKGINALPVLAHPLHDVDAAVLRKLLPEAINAGLVGMETYHSSYDTEKQTLAAEIAAEFSLAQSGGSDFHGERKENLFLGVGYGNLEIPLEIYENLRKLKAE